MPIARRGLIFAACLSLSGLVLLLDRAADPQLSLFILYLVPVALAAWFAGLPEAVGVSVACGLMWGFWDPENRAADQRAAALWNLAAMLGIMLAMAAVLSRLRAALARERVAGENLRRFNETLEGTVRERTAELQRSVRELEGFTYTMAHDLRAPLRAIHGFCHLLLEEHAASVPDDGKAMLRRVSDASGRMDRLILDLLEFGRLIHHPVRRIAVSMRSLLERCVEELAPTFVRRAAEVRVEEPIPDLVGDPELLPRVFAELLRNAVTFTDAGRPPRVRIRGEVRDGRGRIWIEDNGIGIDPAYQARIFGAFERLGHAAQEPEGTGMGLAIVRKTVERLGGSAGVESQPGQGSRFWVELPLALPDPRPVRSAGEGLEGLHEPAPG
jgi:signal transduction histidine kinase